MFGSQEDGMYWRRRTVAVYHACGLDADTAEDLAGEVVLRLLQAREGGAVLTMPYWMATVRSVRDDYLRRLRVASRASDDLVRRDTTVDPEFSAVRHLWYEECLACLTPEQQHIVLRAFGAG